LALRLICIPIAYIASWGQCFDLCDSCLKAQCRAKGVGHRRLRTGLQSIECNTQTHHVESCFRDRK
jgi:hypothetical protein